MELFKDLNWVLVLGLAALGAAPLIFVPKPIKDRRWLGWSVAFFAAAAGALIYFITR